MLGTGRQNRSIMCYVALVMVLTFFMLYYMLSRLGSGTEHDPTTLTVPHE